MKNIEETRIYFIKEIDQNEFMSNKLKKVCTTLNHVKKSTILVSAVTGYI